MAVISLSPEWAFPSSITHYDVPTYGIELADHTAMVHQSPTVNKRRARETEWDDEGEAYAKAKKAKVAASQTVEPPRLQKEYETSIALSTSTTQQPEIEQVISILVDALSTTRTPPPVTPSENPIKEEQEEPTVLPSNTPPIQTPTHSVSPTSPLSNAPNRAPFVRKAIGGSCAGKTEQSLSRWVLCRNHFLNFRRLDPLSQTQQWMHDLRAMGWEPIHPYFQNRFVPPVSPQGSGTLTFSAWVEDDYDYDAAEDYEGDWSDEEEEGEGEFAEHEVDVTGQTGVWDSGIVLHLPSRSQ